MQGKKLKFLNLTFQVYQQSSQRTLNSMFRMLKVLLRLVTMKSRTESIISIWKTNIAIKTSYVGTTHRAFLVCLMVMEVLTAQSTAKKCFL